MSTVTASTAVVVVLGDAVTVVMTEGVVVVLGDAATVVMTEAVVVVLGDAATVVMTEAVVVVLGDAVTVVMTEAVVVVLGDAATGTVDSGTDVGSGVAVPTIWPLWPPAVGLSLQHVSSVQKPIPTSSLTTNTPGVQTHHLLVDPIGGYASLPCPEKLKPCISDAVTPFVCVRTAPTLVFDTR